MFSSMLTFFQNLGKALMLPIAVLPIAGLMLRLGQPDLLDIKFIADAGNVIFANLPLLFAIGVAVGFSVDSAGAAALAGVVAYLTLTTGLKALGSARGLSLDMGVLAGILSGIIGGMMYNRFFKLRLPSYLAFFSGKRFVPIISALAALAGAAVLSFCWPPIQFAINTVGNWLVGAGALGAAVFGVLNRLLLAVGLHQILNTLCWFQFGSYTPASGVAVHGDLNRFFAGDPTAGLFMTGFFPVMMFGLPAVALAFYLTTKKERRPEVAGLLISLVLTAFLTGITEPLEYTFMFLAPVLYLIHAILTGAAMALSALFGYHAGFTFSAGAIDLLLSWGKSVRPEMIFLLGPFFFAVYFFLFYYAIKFFDLKTPGRGEAVVPDAGKSAANGATGAGRGDERYDRIGAGYIRACGGLENLKNIDNCITRLRLTIADMSRIDEAAIKRLGASGIIRLGGGALQIIVGSQVEFVADAMKKFARSGVVPSVDDTAAESVPAPAENVSKPFDVLAPVEGTVVALDDVPDDTFARRMAGDGVAIAPTGAVFRSPVAGTILSLPSSGHAFVVRLASGAEVLVHVGIETVALKGEGFRVLAKVGDAVVAGTPVLEVDWAIVKAKAKSTLSPVLVSSPELASSIVLAVKPGQTVNPGDLLLSAGGRIPLPPPTPSETADGPEFAMDCRIVDPNGIHARPAARLTGLFPEFHGQIRMRCGEREADLRSVGALMALGIGGPAEVTVIAVGAGAEAAVRRVAAALEKGVDGSAAAENAALDFSGAARLARGPNAISGVAASPGIGIAPIFLLADDTAETTRLIERSSSGVSSESEALEKAVAAAAEQLRKLSDEMIARRMETSGAVFEAHAALVTDVELKQSALKRIQAGANAARAWMETCREQGERLRLSGDARLAQRAGDYRDIGERVIRLLAAEEDTPEPYPETPFLLVARDLTPSRTANLAQTRVAGIITAEGGPTAHTAILARALGIPAVVAATDAVLKLRSGAVAILDGAGGFLEPSPTGEQLDAAQKAAAADAARREKADAARFDAACSTDGATVEVAANITGAEDALKAVAAGADGVGLLRTEIMVQDCQEPPTEDFLLEKFTAVAAAMRGKSVVVRTYDIGGDKPVAFMPQAHEDNPFLGIRGLRLCFEYPDVFRTQLRALLRAVRDRNLNAKIMFPMVGDPEEFRAARAIVAEEAARLQTALPPIGMMIEVPSAVLRIREFAAVADFFSIGTNDLTQYVLAVDRSHPKLAGKADALDPAVLNAISTAVSGAHAQGKWIGVCGNLASDPAGAAILFGMGVDELSVGAAAVGATKAGIRALSRKQAAMLAEKALGCASAAAVRALF